VRAEIARDLVVHKHANVALIQVTDNGAPPLTSFQRVVLTVKMP